MGRNSWQMFWDPFGCWRSRRSYSHHVCSYRNLRFKFEPTLYKRGTFPHFSCARIPWILIPLCQHSPFNRHLPLFRFGLSRYARIIHKLQSRFSHQWAWPPCLDSKSPLCGIRWLSLACMSLDFSTPSFLSLHELMLYGAILRLLEMLFLYWKVQLCEGFLLNKLPAHDSVFGLGSNKHLGSVNHTCWNRLVVVRKC